ncbi:hypothetical protein N7548_03215 [Acholeplasma manati]|uniref:DUF4352 domain-containing protein n=1 Tax=Paracholeplasma manati TaxID=591373 RepID=A0ABT2Y527_9MOLU|nr:hypothetical protein [Paracholeplasma manati]MCV2231831.1 hypothetical protein [Paracholeplasma manati]
MKKIYIILFLMIITLSGCQNNGTIVRYSDDLSIKQDGIIYLVDSFYENGSNLTFRISIENTTDESQILKLEDLFITRLSNEVGYPVNCRIFDNEVTVSSKSKQNLSCVVVLPTSIEDEHYKLTFNQFVFNLFEKK